MRPEDLEPPKPIRKVIIDDRFHPLDHRIASKRCRSFPKGIRLHWSYAKDFGPHWDNPPWIWYRKLFHCWIGRHKYSTWWKTNEKKERVFYKRVCSYCDKPDPDMITQERIT